MYDYSTIQDKDLDKCHRAFLVHKLVTKEGTVLNDPDEYRRTGRNKFTKGQKIIMECILARKSPTPEQLRRIHIECITRYGKSMCIGAALAIRASGSKKPEPWAIVAPTQDKAQIIMDYAIQFATNDFTMRLNLLIDPPELQKIDKLKEHKAKDHITFKRGGEIRAFTAGQGSSSNVNSGNALMGFGSPNVIEDECYLIDDQTHSKVMRMLGDNPHNNFLMKIGNPFNRNHGLQSRQSPEYFRLILDHNVALDEGRLTTSFLNEMRDKPNFSVLYECLPPESDAQDAKGYYPLFTDKLLKDCQIEETALAPFGIRRDGVDVADGGDNYSSIVSRWENMAKIRYRTKGMRTMEFASQVALNCDGAHQIKWDGTGVGTGAGQLLHTHPIIGDRFESIKVGEPSSEPEKFFNLRAEIYWKLKVWLESGGKLVKHPAWEQLLVVKYKVNQKGQIQIISKDELRKQNIMSPDEADALSLTFAPDAPAVSNIQGGGIAGMNTEVW